MPNNLHVSALYLAHLQAYIRRGVFTIHFRFLYEISYWRNIELRWCLQFTVTGDEVLLLTGFYDTI
jgi:hypothetical protein